MSYHVPSWVGSSGMPPLGCGMLMPQPNAESTQSSVDTKSTKNDNINNPALPFQFHSYVTSQNSQSQQRQWPPSSQQKKEEQIVLNAKMKKQRHFDEQKQRLKDLDTKKAKNTFSADAMIQNILTKNEKSWSIVHKSPKEERNISGPSIGLHQSVNQMESTNLGTTFGSALHPQVSTGTKLHNNPQSLSPQQSCHINATSNRKDLVQQKADTHHFSLNHLPKWLKETSEIPAIYKAACGLVEDKDGWIDTKRAYMLLMKTNIHPQYLGVVWEMVNRTKPGLLKIEEFRELLALVALLQKGLTFTSPDVLSMQVEPVYPLIDHPVLLPLVEEELKKKRTKANQEELKNENQCTSTVAQLPFVQASKVNINFETDDGDDFNEFVSAVPPPCIKQHPPPTISQNLIHTKQQLFKDQWLDIEQSVSKIKPCHSTQSQQNTIPIISSVPISNVGKKADNERSLNFPRLGNSPQNVPASPHKESNDDFDAFQSAPTTSITQKDDTKVPVLDMSKILPTSNVQDKYAAFREFSTDNEDGFGDFCSSAPIVTIPTTCPNDSTSARSAATDVTCLKFSNYGQKDTKRLHPDQSDPKSSNIGFTSSKSSDIVISSFMSNEIANADSDWAKDVFGEFESRQKIMFSADFSSDSSQYVTASASAATSSDDDFGDFIGPTTVTIPSISSVPYITETVSVNSLELPGLEMTVNLTSDKNDSKPESLTLSDAFIDEEFKTLSLGSTPRENNDNSLHLAPSSIDAVPIIDKYSLIRGEETKTNLHELHIEPWSKCLQSCIKLLEEAVGTLLSIQDSSFLQQVLSTSQMQDYLANLREVNKVRRRISSSGKTVPVTPTIEEYLSTADSLWKSILDLTGDTELDALSDNENAPDHHHGGAVCCSVCLGNGDVSLTYGSFSYHPPCANLWLNAVDFTLPTLNQTRKNFL